MNWQPKSTVVVPIDFSGHCVEAVRTALQYVEQPAHVHLIHAVVPLESNSPAVLWGEIDQASREQRVREYFADYTRENNFPGITVVVRTGTPGETITDYAADAKADLIVISSHGYGGVKRLLLGSVAERVLRLAICPVLVLPRDDDN